MSLLPAIQSQGHQSTNSNVNYWPGLALPLPGLVKELDCTVYASSLMPVPLLAQWHCLHSAHLINATSALSPPTCLQHLKTFIIGTAHIICGAGFVRWYVVCLSSVPFTCHAHIAVGLHLLAQRA